MHTIDNYEIYGQILGFIALLIGLSAYTHHNLTKLKLTISISSLFLASSYFFLHGNTAATIIVVIAIRQFISIYSDKLSFHNKVILSTFFISFSFLLLLLTWQGLVSVLPFLASLIATIAYFFANSITLRKSGLVTDSIWIINATILHLYPHLIACILAIGINLFMIKKIMHHEKNITPSIEV
jgi:glucan phosphoethanolaminetransferase (alkaline phosphatase superfamily)